MVDERRSGGRSSEQVILSAVTGFVAVDYDKDSPVAEEKMLI